MLTSEWKKPSRSDQSGGARVGAVQGTGLGEDSAVVGGSPQDCRTLLQGRGH